MRRLARHAFTALAALSLLLCVAACVLWVRSYGSGENLWVSDRGDGSINLDVVAGHVTIIHVGSGDPTGAAHYVRRSYPPNRSGTVLRTNPRRWGAFGYGSRTAPQEESTRDDLRRASARLNRFFRERGYGAAPARGDESRELYEADRVITTHAAIHEVLFPVWAVVAATCALPVILATSLVGRWRRYRRGMAGLCPACGYDLRASSGRCPECGADRVQGRGRTPRTSPVA